MQTTPTRVAASTDQKGQTLRHSTVSVLRGRPPPASRQSRQHKDSKNAIILLSLFLNMLHLATQLL